MGVLAARSWMLSAVSAVPRSPLTLCVPCALCQTQVRAAQRRLQALPYSSTVRQVRRERACVGQRHKSSLLWLCVSCVLRRLCCQLSSPTCSPRRGQGVTDSSQAQYQGPPPVKQLMDQAAGHWQVRVCG